MVLMKENKWGRQGLIPGVGEECSVVCICEKLKTDKNLAVCY